MTDAPQVEIHTLHQALTEASLEKTHAGDYTTATYKVSPTIKKLASDICVLNGATLSAYLRKCVELLVKDYGGNLEA